MDTSHQILVMGAGAWGTALALHAARAGYCVHLWARKVSPLPSRAMPRLSEFPLPPTICVSSDLPTSLATPLDCVLIAIPTQSIASVMPFLPQGVPALLCCKGLEKDTLSFPLDILARERPDLSGAVLSGPNFAREIAAGLPAASVIAASDITFARVFVEKLATPLFRLYTSSDVKGVQLGGAAKNVIALAAGITMGACLGENARAALITRGLAEITRLAFALGAQPATLAGLAGLGDLLLTCTSSISRNYQLGFDLGKGASFDKALSSLPGVAEGVTTASALLALAHRYQVDVPITECITAFLEGRITLSQAQQLLLSRPLKEERFPSL